MAAMDQTARWLHRYLVAWASNDPDGIRSLGVIRFAGDGRATSFEEWFMEPGPVRADQV